MTAKKCCGGGKVRKAQSGDTIRRTVGDTTGLAKRVISTRSTLDSLSRGKSTWTPAQAASYQKNNPLNKPIIVKSKKRRR